MVKRLWRAIDNTDRIKVLEEEVINLKGRLGLPQGGRPMSEYEVELQCELKDLERERDYLDARLAEFERLAEEFVQFKAPDHMCRMEFIQLLNMGKWRQR